MQASTVTWAFAAALPDATFVALPGIEHAYDIAAGADIVKYGARIGIATRAIGRGQHVHVHNMKSGYLPTYTLDAAHRYLGRTE